MKKNLLGILSLLILASMLLTACGGAATTEAPKPAEPTAAPAEPVEEEKPAEEEQPAEVEEPEVADETFDSAFLDGTYGTMLANMEGYNTVRAEGLMEELVGDAPPFLLDVRTTAEVEEQGHITGAAHMPLENLTQALNMLPGPDDPIVVYCGSGWRATIAMTSLHGMGWTNVRALKTSFADWVEAGNPVTEGLPGPFPANMMAYPQPMLDVFDASLAIYGVKPYSGIDAESLNTALGDSPEMVVIDVRTAGELEENGTIDTGDVELLAIPLQDFVASQDMWPADLGAQISIYCGSGHRSTMAVAILGSYGYTNVSSLKGGFGGWASAGYPVVGGMAAPEASEIDMNFETMLANMVGYNTIKADGLMEELVGDNPPVLLDVRTSAEVEENGHIEGALHMPLENLTAALNMLPATDAPIVTYCGSGWRATIAMTALHGMGYTDVRALKTSFADWVEAGNPVVEGLPAPAPANTMEYPPELTGPFDAALAIYGVKPYGVISADDLNLALGDNPDLVVIDVRTAGEVEEKGYIEATNWIHIPLEAFMAEKANWPAADAQIAVYCGSGHRSTMALAMLGANGYNNVSSLKGGFGGWMEAGYPIVAGMGAGEAEGYDFDAAYTAMLESMEGYNTIKADGLMEAMVMDEPPFILDVRTAAEVEEQGHIEGAVHIQLDELAQNLNSLPGYNTPIVTYCGSGWRATIAMTALSAAGWEDVKALKTTFGDWVAEGYPVADGLPEPSLVASAVEFDPALVATLDEMLQVYGVKPFGVMSADDLNLALVENPDMIVIDARTEGELTEKGVIDAADVEFIHIALEDFIANMDMWPADAEADITIYCGSGHRSTMALTILGTYGYTNVSSLKGGFGGWVEAGFPVAEFAAP